MNIVLREATSADLDAVVEVFLACWRGSYAAVLDPNAKRLPSAMHGASDSVRSWWRKLFA